jgi:hypothetical protein
MRPLLRADERDAPDISHGEVLAGPGLFEDVPHALLREAVVLDRVLRRVVGVELAVCVELDDHEHPARPKPGHEALGGETGLVEMLVGMCGVNSVELFLSFFLCSLPGWAGPPS